MKVAVLDYGAGNLRSVAKALEAAEVEVVVSGEPASVRHSDALCVPGQGIFGRCMANLTSKGLDDLIRDWIARTRPYLGICLGMQVLFESSEEPGEKAAGLGVLAGEVKRLPDGVTIPHIGWNEVAGEGLRAEYFYFDHSYAPHPSDEGVVRGWCEHGHRFAAWIEAGPMTAVQFHPEKSSGAGISLMRSWVTSL